jgi:hypothetical protein
MPIPVNIRTRRAALVVAFGLGAWLQAGEKVELRGSTSIELPKPARVFEESRRFKGLDSGASELEGGFMPPAQNNSAGAVDRKLREMLDRKRNWIFANPYETQYDSRTSEILETDKNSGLTDHRLLQEGEKSMMQKYFEERGGRASNDGAQPNPSTSSTGSPTSSSSSSDTRERQKPDRAQPFSGDDRDSEDRAPALFFDGGNRQNTFFQPADLGLEVSDFQKRMERSPMDGTVFSRNRPDNPSLDKADAKRQQESRDADFNKLIQPRGLGAGVPTLAGQLDPLNTPSDGTRQDAHSFVARRSGQGSSEGVRTDFSGVNRGGGVAANLPSAGSLALDGANSRVSRESSFLPSASSAPAAQGPASGPRPFVFEMPRRKF